MSKEEFPISAGFVEKRSRAIQEGELTILEKGIANLLKARERIYQEALEILSKEDGFDFESVRSHFEELREIRKSISEAREKIEKLKQERLEIAKEELQEAA
ncbi:MAG: hypothetical protein ACOYS2_00170 [Patescibacteria group bacterium]